MHRVMRSMAGLAVGVGLLGMVGIGEAQTVPPRLVPPTTPAPTPTPTPEPTPVTPATPVPLPVGVSFCYELGQTLPEGNRIEVTECQSTAGQLCLLTASAVGASLECTTAWVSTPVSTPPTPTPLPVPEPPVVTN
jgi:hypothetical protein